MGYKEKRNRKFAVVLLVLLFFYAFSLVFIFNNADNDGKTEYSYPTYKSDLAVLSDALEYREVAELEKVKIIEEQGEVLGEDGEVEDPEGHEGGWLDGVYRRFFMGRCNQSNYRIDDPQLFCGGSGSVSGADIKIAEIRAPDVLFTGAAAPFDNLVQTNNPAGLTAFRNASEIINPDFDYLIHMPPLPDDHEGNPRRNLASDGELKETYDMHYETLGEIDEVEFDVHPDEQSYCPDVVNDGRFNVRGSNQLQKDLTDIFSPPGLMALGDRDVSVDLCRADVRTIHMDEDETFLLCRESLLQKFWCGIINTFSANDDACDDVHGIVVDAPLGSGEICNEEDCSIRYTEAARIISSPPIWTKDLYPEGLSDDERKNDYIVDDPVIIRTPCKVRVDCAICLTDCFWDISIWQNHFDLEKTYTYPGFRNAMDEDEYWEEVEAELKFRGALGQRNFH